jgi:hypothetical protein
MKILRKSNKWLLHRINSQLRSSYQELYHFDLKNWFHNFLCDKRSGLNVFFSAIIIFFIILLVPVDFMKLDKESVPIMLDQRISNLATIISLTLVIFSLLINNIAVKETFAYRILFRHSYLYFTLFFALTVIGVLILATNFRHYNDEIIVRRIAVAASILAVIILFLIGVLFVRLIFFLDTNEIHKIYRAELHTEAIRLIKLQLQIIYSKKTYIDIVSSYGLGKFNPVAFRNTLQYAEEFGESIELKTISDVKIGEIEKSLRLMQKENILLIFNPIFIGYSFRKDERLFWYENNYRSNQRFLNLKEKLRFSKVGIENLDVQNFFHDKYERCVKEVKVKEADFILSCYLELYKLQMKYIDIHD